MRLDLGTYGSFDLVKRRTSRQMRFANGRLGNGDDFRAVDHFALVLAENRDLAHVLLKRGPHVVFILDVLLPIAGRARIYREQ